MKRVGASDSDPETQNFERAKAGPKPAFFRDNSRSEGIPACAQSSGKRERYASFFWSPERSFFFDLPSDTPEKRCPKSELPCPVTA
jgi:hypothetical protein